MENEAKDSRQFKILYDWLQLTRKPNQSLRADLKMMMDLIQIPISVQEVNFFMKIIDPQGKKNRLQQDDFLNCFIVPEQAKKQKEKELTNAFKSLFNNTDQIPFEKLFDLLKEEGLDEYTASMVLKQMGEWETDEGAFDYKKFVEKI